MPIPIWAMSFPTVRHQQDFVIVSIQLRCDSFPRRIWKKRATGNMESFLRRNSSSAPALHIFDASSGGSSLVQCQGHSEAGITEEKVTAFNNIPLFFCRKIPTNGRW